MDMLNKGVKFYVKIPSRFWEIGKKPLGATFLTHPVDLVHCV